MLAALAGCSEEPRIERLQGPMMGTTYHVSYVADVSVHSVVVADAVRGALQAVDLRMSTYRADSELMRFNQLAIDTPFAASPELLQVVGQSLALSQISGGAFDVTVGPLVNLWGFGPDLRTDKAPTEAALAAAFTRVGYQALTIEEGQLLKKQDVFVDLSAIAKGYGVDRIAQALEELGVHNYLVEVGGELRIGGRKPGGQDWLIGIEEPNSELREARLAIRAPGQAIATSGDYRNYFEEDGIRYSHTINPKTGRPVTNKLASVTVVSEECMVADAWATLLMVLGETEGLRLATNQGVAAYFIYHDASGFKSVYTDTFSPYLTQQGTL